MPEIGLSTCGKPFGERLFADYAAAGIKYMEISYGKDACESFDFSLAKKYADAYGVGLWSFHLPFMPFFEIDISSSLLAKKTTAYLAEFIKKGADIGIEKFIVHPSGEPIAPFDRDRRMDISKTSLFELNSTAKEAGAVICVEDLPRTCLGRDSEEILELISAAPELRVCFDTNHLLKEKIPDFIHRVGEKIVTVHVSDYDFADEKHWLPGEGKINWSELISALDDIGYDGVWLYEVGYRAPRSMPRPRDLTAADFADNKKMLFNEK